LTAFRFISKLQAAEKLGTGKTYLRGFYETALKRMIKVETLSRSAEALECTGTSVTLWTGDIHYSSLAVVRLKFGFNAGSLLVLLNI
jgi:hypothetical protein